MRKNHGIVVVIVFDESVNTAEEWRQEDNKSISHDSDCYWLL